MSLGYNIEILTREHKAVTHTIDGPEIHTRNGLLHELREAVFGGMESTGGGSALQSRLPISDAALDLYQLIDRQITEAWCQAHKNQVPGTDRAEALAAQWSALVDEDRIVEVTYPETRDTDTGPVVFRICVEYKAGELAQRWVQQIETFFDPPRAAEIQAPCFVCGERYVYRRKDGETVQSAALSFIRDRQTGETLRAECASCGTQWAPSQFKYLGEMIAKTDTPDATTM